MQHCRNFIRIAARIPPFQRFGVRSLWDARTGLPVSGTNLSGGGPRSLVVEASDQDSPLSSTDMFGDELPSEKQVAYAKALADRVGMAQHDIPAAALASKVGASAFIGSLNDQIPPTIKQLEFVTKLCQRQGMNPETVGDRTGSFKATSEFIEELLGSSADNNGAKPKITGQALPNHPSKAQIDFMVSLAQQSQRGIPYEALVDRSAASQFVEEARSSNNRGSSNPTASSNNSPSNAAKSRTSGIMSYSFDNIARGSGEAIEAKNEDISPENKEKDVPF